jgi:transcriptional regulator with XRE-family HTH domain
METETITTGLKKYAIGSKLRRLRLRKSMGLLELSKHTGLSPALLSKLERDLMHPTLPTLLRIAFPVADRAINSYFAEFQPLKEADAQFHEHPGIEFLYVLSGSLELCVGKDRHELAQGDAVYFDCSVAHSYRMRGSKRTTAIVVATET